MTATVDRAAARQWHNEPVASQYPTVRTAVAVLAAIRARLVGSRRRRRRRRRRKTHGVPAGYRLRAPVGSSSDTVVVFGFCLFLSSSTFIRVPPS